MSQDHRAVREIECSRDASRQDVVDLVRREVAGDLVQDLDELAPVFRVFTRAPELLFAVLELLVRRPKNGAHSELRLNPRQQLTDTKRLPDEIGRAKSERLDRRLLGRER